jgi:hypothetical protein
VRYAAYGHVIDSVIDLPELADAGDAVPDIAIRCAARGSFPSAVVRERSATRRRARGPWLQVEPRADSFALRFGSAAVFSLSRDAGTIVAHHHGARPSETARHLLLDQVLPLALSHRGHLVLHGSGVIVDGRAVAFVGPGGAGKSTLAASFGRAGGAVLADDALVIDTTGAGAVAHASYPGIRLWPDAVETTLGGVDVPRVADYTEKRRVDRTQQVSFLDRAQTIARMYVVQPRSAREPRIEALSKRQAVIALLTHSYVLDVGDASRLAAQLGAACRILDRIPVRALSYPRRFDRLPDVRAAIRRDVDG